MHMNQKSLLRWFGDAEGGVPPIKVTPAHQTATVTATLTDAQMLGEVLVVDQGSGATSTLTTRTAAQIEGAFAGRLEVGESWELIIINVETDAGGNVVLAMGTGFTLIGNNDIEEEDAVDNSSTGVFRFRKTATNTFDCYRIG